MNSRREISDDVVTFHSSKDIAKKIGISPITLKKYSLLIEKVSEGGVLYERNDKNSRLYSDTDVLLIIRTLKIRDTEAVPFEKAAKIVLIEEGVISEQNDGTPAVLTNYSEKEEIKEIYSVLNTQNTHIASLIEANKELIDTNKQLSNQMEQILKKINIEESKKLNQPEKKKWWRFK